MSRVILALGSDIKNRFLVARDKSFYFGPDIGDLGEAKNYEFFKKEVYKAIRKNKPDIIACDLHPGYFSSLFAKELKASLEENKPNCLNLVYVQHHHAHIASVLAEKRIYKPVIGVSFDGTGFGTDTNFWGGEFLLVDRRGFKRLAYLKYRKLPGADKAVSEPWRMVLSILGKQGKNFIKGIKKKEQDLVLAMVSKNINSPLTSSAGRLFDAAASLVGICLKASYEAEGPIKLEALCDKKIKQRYGFRIIKNKESYIIDTDPLFLGILNDLKKAEPKKYIATKFHNSLAEIIIKMVGKMSKKIGIKDVALSGGVFQNKFLREKAIKGLSSLGFRVYTNSLMPTNDFNIALGQYYVACFKYKKAE